MNWLSFLLPFLHVVGLVLAVGSATAKLAVLLKCNTDPGLVPEFLRFSRTVTRLIIIGMFLLTLSGIGWLLQGYPFTTLLIVKIVLVVCIWVLGPVIDTVVEPKFGELAPAAGEAYSPAFAAARRRYVALEIFATFLFYVIIAIGVLL